MRSEGPKSATSVKVAHSRFFRATSVSSQGLRRCGALKSSVCSNYRREESSHARNRVASEIKGLVSRFHQYSHASELLTMQTERQKRHYNRVMCNLYSN